MNRMEMVVPHEGIAASIIAFLAALIGAIVRLGGPRKQSVKEILSDHLNEDKLFQVEIRQQLDFILTGINDIKGTLHEHHERLLSEGR